jgi:hypothetical protein
MRWLGGIGGSKCGGGWYDWLGTTERTYLEQARQTILGGARESMLFCYGGLQGTTGPKNVAALRGEIPELFQAAKAVLGREIIGVSAYKPPHSPARKEARVFDFVGMLGLPLVPCHEFPTNSKAAFFSVHALKEAGFTEKLQTYIASGRPVLLTDGLVDALGGSVDVSKANVYQIKVGGDPKSLLQISPTEIGRIRAAMLKPFQAEFEAPASVALYLFKDGSSVIENFRDEAVTVRWQGKPGQVPARGWVQDWRR